MNSVSSRNARKKIGLLHYAGPPIVGGVESVMGHHARLMKDAGHHVRIIAGRGERLSPEISFEQVPLVDSQNSEILQAKAQLDQGKVPDNFDMLTQRIFDELARTLAGFDILFAHNVCTMSKNLPLTSALRKFGGRQGAPALIAWHHDLAATAERYRHELHSGWPWSLVQEDWEEVPMQHVVVSEARREELCGLMKIAPEKVRVIPSGIDTHLFHNFVPFASELVDRLKLLERAPVFLLPVRITRRKNIELAIRVIAELGNVFPESTLIVTGPPGAHNATNQDYFEYLCSLRSSLSLEPSAAELNGGSGPLSPRVHFLSELSETYMPDEVIADLYQVADGLLITSNDEGFGIPIIEAGLARIPIFCSDILPFREIAGEFATYFSPDGAPEEIAQHIVRTLESDPQHALRQKVKKRYSWEAVYRNQIQPLLEVGL